jgi:hypothetical protein
MFYDFFASIAEILFVFTGGILFIETFWFFLWVFSLVFVFVLTIPFWFAFNTRTGQVRAKYAFTSMLMFFPILMLIMGPPVIQLNMMSECKIVSAEIIIEGNSSVRDVRMCRVKENFYDAEFGEWFQSQTD